MEGKVKSIKGCLFWYVVLTSPDNLTLQTQLGFCMFSFRHTPGGDKPCNQERGDLPSGRRSRAPGCGFQLGAAAVSLGKSASLGPCFISKIRDQDSLTFKLFQAQKFYLNAHVSNYRASLPNNFFVLDDEYMLYLFFFLSTNECSGSLGMPSYIC